MHHLVLAMICTAQGHEYELLYDGEGETGERFVMGLSGPGIEAQDAAPGDGQMHPYDADRSGQNGSRSPSGRGVVGDRSAPGREDESGAKPRPARGCDDDPSASCETNLPRLNGSAASYPHPGRPIAARRQEESAADAGDEREALLAVLDREAEEDGGSVSLAQRRPVRYVRP
ncbi:MAG: hypothetical protein C0510_00405 [Erythrobacter sp.]|nr:hypothetical protein [Erythrobacter sp.]